MGFRQGLEGAVTAEIEVKCSCRVVLGQEDKGGIHRERQEQEGWQERGPNALDAVCSQRPFGCRG